jgi:hypothetical protein
MSAKTYIVDSSNTTRFPKRIIVVDSGNVSRVCKRIFVVDAGNVSRLIFTGADYLTLVSGNVSTTNGYVRGTIGSLTPSTLGDGALVQEIAAKSTTPFTLIFDISGYAGTITSSYLISLTITNTVFLATSAVFTGGSAGGTAQWQWTTGFNLINGDTFSVAVNRSA